MAPTGLRVVFKRRLTGLLRVYLFAAPSTYQKVAHIVMPDGSRWTFVDNGTSTFTPPLGRHDTLVRNPDGSFQLTLQRSRVRLLFGTSGSLTSLIDDFGNTLNYSYDGSGRIQTIADGAGSGRSLTVSWGGDGRISSVRDQTTRQVQYGYTQGKLTTVTDLAGRITTYGYATGRFGPILNQVKDPWNRIVSDVVYNSSDRIQTYTEHGEQLWVHVLLQRKLPRHGEGQLEQQDLVLHVPAEWTDHGQKGPVRRRHRNAHRLLRRHIHPDVHRWRRRKDVLHVRLARQSVAGDPRLSGLAGPALRLHLRRLLIPTRWPR